ncbi:hypothetical protein [Novosphingobium album (ex Liu et al. 2023)]|uniref:hypothetical protein n=1 Tax=Novosphingobium album (ex Liu et al. 2023) TaxID=3031130 RepID=UPI0023B0A078|nr:hypothetical protein [Novosphingobium album (ex Liu et al. 2023)]
MADDVHIWLQAMILDGGWRSSLSILAAWRGKGALASQSCRRQEVGEENDRGGRSSCDALSFCVRRVGLEDSRVVHPRYRARMT